MAGRNISNKRATVTGATAGGLLTVDSSAGMYVGAKAWLSLTDNSKQDFVEITSIPDGTHVGVRKVVVAGQGPNYGRSDVSAYNGGGFLDQEDQFIYNRNDAPAP